MIRSGAQIRLEASIHEAGHAVAMHVLGLGAEIDTLELMRVEEVRADGLSGCVQRVPGMITTLADAIDEILVGLAGEAAFRIAWQHGLLLDDEIGGEAVEPPLEALLAVPNGNADVVASHLGYIEHDAHPDERNAEALARHFTSNALEAEFLLKWLRLRAAAMVARPEFLAVVLDVAKLLRRHSSLSGEQAREVMHRSAVVHELEVRESR